MFRLLILLALVLFTSCAPHADPPFIEVRMTLEADDNGGTRISYACSGGTAAQNAETCNAIGRNLQNELARP